MKFFLYLSVHAFFQVSLDFLEVYTALGTHLLFLEVFVPVEPGHPLRVDLHLVFHPIKEIHIYLIPL